MTVAARVVRLADGIELHEGFDKPQADAFFDALRDEVAVRQESLRFGGRDVPMPRLTAWYGDHGARYAYSGLLNEPQPWTPTLAEIRTLLVAAFDSPLNSCLVNAYRDGNDKINWHSDNERGLRGMIVSASFGAPRWFEIKPITDAKRGDTRRIRLTHGSVLTMTVASQAEWVHRVPAEVGAGRRLNLTYRTVPVGPPRL